jgi:hypothetical protein
MPPFKKSPTSGAAPKRASTSAAPVRKAGSKSEGHRGYRPSDGAAEPKKRWTTSDRAQRAAGATASGDRKPFRGRDADGGRPASTDRRPDWTPREKPAYRPRTERAAYGDRTERPARPAYNDRTQRPSYGDRTERPSYGDRAPRTERPTYSDRPSYKLSSGTH